MYYIYDPSDNPAGWGGSDRGGYSESMLQAIDYATGKIRWTHPWKSGGSTGVLSTAGNLVFTGGSGGSKRSTPQPASALWHARIGTVTNAPITYELDGEQHIVVASGNNVVAFVMNR